MARNHCGKRAAIRIKTGSTVRRYSASPKGKKQDIIESKRIENISDRALLRRAWKELKRENNYWNN